SRPLLPSLSLKSYTHPAREPVPSEGIIQPRPHRSPNPIQESTYYSQQTPLRALSSQTPHQQRSSSWYPASPPRPGRLLDPYAEQLKCKTPRNSEKQARRRNNQPVNMLVIEFPTTDAYDAHERNLDKSIGGS